VRGLSCAAKCIEPIGTNVKMKNLILQLFTCFGVALNPTYLLPDPDSLTPGTPAGLFGGLFGRTHQLHARWVADYPRPELNAFETDFVLTSYHRVSLAATSGGDFGAAKISVIPLANSNM
jgi:hypothetical protein